MSRVTLGSFAVCAILFAPALVAQTRQTQPPNPAPPSRIDVPVGGQARQAGDPVPDVDVSLEKKPNGRSYRGTVAPDKTIQLLQVPPGQYTLIIRFKDAAPVPQPAPGTGSQPTAKTFFESRSNTVRLVAPNPALAPKTEWRKFEGEFPWVFGVTGPNVRPVTASIVRSGGEVRIEQEVFIDGNQPATIGVTVRNAPANLQLVPERNISH